MAPKSRSKKQDAGPRRGSSTAPGGGGGGGGGVGGASGQPQARRGAVDLTAASEASVRGVLQVRP
jgi:hypothetical protein